MKVFRKLVEEIAAMPLWEYDDRVSVYYCSYCKGCLNVIENTEFGPREYFDKLEYHEKKCLYRRAVEALDNSPVV